MDKSLLMARGGIRSAKKTLDDGNEHTLHFKAKTPNEIATYSGAERRIPETAAGDLLREKMRAEFIAGSLCDETGAALMTVDEALLVPATLKPELCHMILLGSSETTDAGKG